MIIDEGLGDGGVRIAALTRRVNELTELAFPDLAV